MAASVQAGAPSKPSFDLDYSIDDYSESPYRDNAYLVRRLEQLMLSEAAAVHGRALDVACGVGKLAAGISEHGGQGWGLDPSPEMLGISRWLYPNSDALLLRGVAERLPFRDQGFDRLICQGSLDHFVDPHTFMNEAGRCLRPGGRVIIALANFESLSCRLGRLRAALAGAVRRRSAPAQRPYWEPPPDHFHRGDLGFVRGLGGKVLRLERCYGVSLMWPFYGWGRLLDALPSWLANAVLGTLDKIAFRMPGLADVIVSVWEPVPLSGEAAGQVEPARSRPAGQRAAAASANLPRT